MDVSIIIINYNTKDLIKQCIDSVLEKTQDIEFEIIVVDNASSDGSQQFIKNVYPNIIFIESPDNLGFGRANNLGFEYAKGRNLFLLNSDTILLNNAVKILSDYLDSNIEAGVCGGNLYDEKGSPVFSFSRSLSPVLSELNFFFKGILFKIMYRENIEFNHTSKPLKVGYITGADMMLRSSVFGSAGQFDRDFFMYSEDIELTYRIKKSGFSVYSVPDAHIIHLIGRSSQDDYNKLKIMINSTNLYLKKTQGRFKRKIVRMLIFLNIYSNILSYKFYKKNNRKLKYWKSTLQISKVILDK